MADNGKVVKKSIDFVLELPDADTPGYLRRLEAMLTFKELLAEGFGNLTPKDIRDIVEFILIFVKDTPRDEAIDYLYELSEAQFIELFAILSGDGSKEAQIEPDIPLMSAQEPGDG